MAEITRKEYATEKPILTGEPFGRLFNLGRDRGVQRNFNVTCISHQEFTVKRKEIIRQSYLVGSEGGLVFEYESEPGSRYLKAVIHSQGNHESVQAVAEDILGIKLKEIPIQENGR